jgi:GxxExxY protein
MNHRDTEAQRRYLNELSGRVIGACIDIHRELGPGLLESAYEECLAYELSIAGLQFERQKPLPVRYKEVQLDCGYRLDLLVEGELIIELKTVSELTALHEAQLLTYLKLQRKSLGLLVNFNVPALVQGVKRVAVGDLFRQESGRSDLLRLCKLLCASVPLWFTYGYRK